MSAAGRKEVWVAHQTLDKARDEWRLRVAILEQAINSSAMPGSKPAFRGALEAYRLALSETDAALESIQAAWYELQ